ncbi:ATP-dependent helicase [Lachnoclostridium sp. Marseille-P6806]|uniref:ATP-dependent helicase n=1 Tax=Lachnoclostridium sp. Marseille-P6806 TaxID=2364793 RepID=UPI0010312A51|nr:UvrD-helicase domain-containing protein [Lachnoclostridium sp. Marseille-P6806]
MSIYDTLNTEQREACFQTQGPVLILAGAGSGKTRVLTHRICYLIDEEGVSPWNILAITFTNKAAGEMRERVDRLVGFGAESVWVSTFHFLCVRILRRHIDQLGYETGFTIYDADDSRTLMKQVMKTLGIDPKELKERTILGAISTAKNELMTPLRYRETHHFDYMERRIGDAYEEYQRQLHKNNALDFDDLLMKTVEMFRSHEEVLENYQERFRYIMVDEYQDTNTAQFELIRLLSARYRNLCVVGDDDQSIYRFRGANIRNILDFEKLFPDAKVIKLEQNYRSTQNVLDAANAVIHNNVNRKNKALWTNRGEGHKVHYRQLDNALEEADFIAGDVKSKLRRDPKLHYRDFAVLYRTNAQARVLEERFVMESIPYRVVGGVNFYARKEIKDLLCYLKVIDNGADDLAVQRIINVPRRGIGATTIERIAEHARQRGIGFYEAMEESGQIVTLSRGAAGKLAPFTEMITRFREYLRENNAQPDVLSELLRKVLADTEYIEDLKAQDPEDAEDRLANIDELISKVVSYEEAAEEEPPTLSGFLEDVALVADIDSVGEEDDRVLLMTLHSAKGLEFSQVYLAGMEDGIFPGQMTIDTGNEEDMEEERRLAYVGITRAKDDLTITTARARMLRGETRFNPPSRFLYEIPEKLLDGRPAKPKNYLEEDFDFEENGPFADYSGGYGRGAGAGGFRTGGRTFVTYGKTGGRSADGRLRAVARKKQTADEHKPFIAQANERQKALSALTKGAPAGGGSLGYGVGDRVLHVKFGEGTVSAIETAARDHKVTVQFDDYGQKVMYAAFAKLEKL